jgi:hypothetical protein
MVATIEYDKGSETAAGNVAVIVDAALRAPVVDDLKPIVQVAPVPA